MTLFDRTWLTFLAAALLLGIALPAARADTEASPAARLDRLETELAAARTTLQLAQGYGVPPADIGDADELPYPRPHQQGPAGLTVRIDRLDNQMRQINGQIEQLQFETRRLSEQLRKFQEDVDFRFQDVGGRSPPPPGGPKPVQKRTDAPESVIEPGVDPQRFATTAPNSARPSRRRRLQPGRRSGCAGSARPLGSPAATAPDGRTSGLSAARTPSRSDTAGLDQNDPDAPLDLTGGRLHAEQSSPPPALTAKPGPGIAPQAAVASPGGVTAGGTVIAGAPANPVKEEFDLALGYYRQKEYENAEKSFAAFLQKNPKSKMASDATYYLGESFFQRGRQREAAEQYLKISTQYANSPRAPDALLRLGQSLQTLGAKEQACATFGEIVRKYPNASASVKSGAEREAKRAQC
ncbi:tol-pal system protein YbgF [Methylocapsa polymorpha]|uniref:Cell division coordinator CpoB n=1 Tax=Methylocapsa polymorpha TaxID=3080828 RepID=A0ABZ0HSS9_9HYPH|nr:tol-pal system protein YbgF [Methylocapsa sp. RX1]